MRNANNLIHQAKRSGDFASAYRTAVC